MKFKFGLLITLMLLQLPALAQDRAIGAKAGLLGIGIEYSHGFGERLAVRGGVYGSSYSFDATESGIAYDFELSWDSLAVALDLHPFTGPFRLSVGLLKNDNGLSAVSTPTQDIVVGDTTYTPAEVGSLIAGVGFDGTAPFLGLGWDWSKSKRFGVSLDLGIVKQGSPVVTMIGTGTLFGDPNFADDIAAETIELRNALDDLDILPFASLGLSFRF